MSKHPAAQSILNPATREVNAMLNRLWILSKQLDNSIARRLAGVDDHSIEDFEKRLKKNLYKIWNRMSAGPLQANKKHSLHTWRGKERREALSISGAERSLRARKRARRGTRLLVGVARNATVR
jgi:hypothetical protein